MKLVISYVLFFISSEVLASTKCSFKEGNSFISLSAPISMLIEHLNIHDSPSLKGISIFHPIEGSSAKKIGGGQFLSKKQLLPYKDAIVFFDKSRELEKSVKYIGFKKYHRVDSVGVDIFKVVERSIKTLSPYLSKSCDKPIQKIRHLSSLVKSKILKIKKSNNFYFFYLGELSKTGRKPNMLVVKDSYPLTLKKFANINLYPSSLSYIPWSSKILKKYVGNTIEIGLMDSKTVAFKSEQVTASSTNIIAKGIHLPGISQLKVLDKLIDIL